MQNKKVPMYYVEKSHPAIIGTIPTLLPGELFVGSVGVPLEEKPGTQQIKT